jgi:pilus assembly protein CpaE
MRTDMAVPREAPDGRRGTVAVAASPGRQAGFLAFVTDDDSEAALRGGLVEIGGPFQIRRGDAATAARVLEREPTPDVLLVDVTALPDPIGALERLAGVCTPEVRVLAVGEQTDISFYRQLTRELGILEYLHKPLTRDTVARLFGTHLRGERSEAETAARGGQIVAVCGVRGGCGATTVAVNLALQLAQTGRGHVALLDLHLRGGTAGLLLGLRSGSGLRVALEEPERVDDLFLERVGVPVEDRVRLIAAEEAMDAMPQPTVEGVQRLLAMLQRRFNQVVIDMPMPPGPAERVAIDLARHRVLVLGPDVAGIRDAIAVRKLLGIGGASRVMTVLNRVGLPGGLKLKLVEEGLGASPEASIPDLPRHLPRAANLGRPALAESAALRRALAPLTQEISAVRSAAPTGGFLARLLGSRSAQ